MTKTITIIGNVGSGKTTLAKILSQRLPADLINGDPFESNPFLPLYARDHSRWSLATELTFAISRSEIIARELEQSLERIRIIDSGLLMGVEVYVANHKLAKTMLDKEITLFRKIVNKVVSHHLIYPDIVIMCECDISKCLARIGSRGRGFESFHTPQYLGNLEICLKILEKKLGKQNIPILKIDTSLDDPNMKSHQYKLLINEVNLYVKRT